MEILMLLGFVIGLGLFSVLALRFGHDSRDIERCGPDL